MHQKLIPIAGNDYLGLAVDMRLKKTVAEAVLHSSISPMASRFSFGLTEIHMQLEKDLASFFNVEKAVVMGAAYHGGPAFFHAAALQGYDLVLCDENVHANIFLGIRGAELEHITYRHLDNTHLAELLESAKTRKVIVATDGLYGISGEIPDLKEAHRLCSIYDAQLFIDDAHGVFANGPTGKGVGELCGLASNDAVILGSMSKAMGCSGGFIVGPEEWIKGCLNSPICRGTAIPSPAIAAACVKSLEIINTEPQRQIKLHQNAQTMRDAAASAGISVAVPNSPVIALSMKDEFEAAALSQAFGEAGLSVPYFKYPSEPRHNLLRSVARSIHTPQELERYSDVLHEFRA